MTQPTSEVETLRSELARLSAVVQTQRDRLDIAALIDTYGYLHDVLLQKSPPPAADVAQENLVKWEAIFTEDVQAVYSKGTKVGNKGMGNVFLPPSPLSSFEAGQWMGANHLISNLTATDADVRSTMSAYFVYTRALPDRTTVIGGFYEWKVKKVEGVWKISYVKPNTVWTAGSNHTGLIPVNSTGELLAAKV